MDLGFVEERERGINGSATNGSLRGNRAVPLRALRPAGETLARSGTVLRHQLSLFNLRATLEVDG